MTTLDWFHGIFDNPNPLPGIGRFVTTTKGARGLVAGYRQNTPQSPMVALIKDIYSEVLVEVGSADVATVEDAEDVIDRSRAVREKPRLRVVS